jgi:hypothetical protein
MHLWQVKIALVWMRFSRAYGAICYGFNTILVTCKSGVNLLLTKARGCSKIENTVTQPFAQLTQSFVLFTQTGVFKRIQASLTDYYWPASP